MGSYLTRDAILAAATLKTEEVAVPEWGGTVLVRELSGRQRDEFEASLAVQRGGKMVSDVRNMRAKLVIRSMVSEDGQPVFPPEDVDTVGELPAAGLDRVFEVASRLSGLSERDQEDLAGNSAAVQNGDSISS